MIIKLLFIIALLFLLKMFIIKFDYLDYYNVTLSLLFILFSYLFVIYGGIKLVIAILTIFMCLIIYSFYHKNDNDTSIIILNGQINLRNMIDNKYSLNSLFSDLKKNNVSFFDQNICALLINNKLEFYSKDEIIGKPISIIIDGKICYNELYLIGKGTKWLNKMISNNNSCINEIFYSFYYNNKLYIIKK